MNINHKTHSLGIDDINDGANLALVLSVVDEDNTANFYETSESLQSHRCRKDNKMRIISFKE